jgi:hypothetical protein
MARAKPASNHAFSPYRSAIPRGLGVLVDIYYDSIQALRGGQPAVRSTWAAPYRRIQRAFHPDLGCLGWVDHGPVPTRGPSETPVDEAITKILRRPGTGVGSRII